jgi:hypothetical protein
VSTALAIAATTAVIRETLQTRFNNVPLGPVGSVLVSALPPDRLGLGAEDANVLNLFLYQVTPNVGWRNMDLPTRDSAGNLVSNPLLALDLHYMMTAYGQEDLAAEVILGYGVQVMHELSVITRAAIQNAFSGSLTAMLTLVAGAQLDQQDELIKITPEYLPAEQLAQLWTGFQDKYRPTAGFLATTVLIQRDDAVPAAFQVRTTSVTVVPFVAPAINAVSPAITATYPPPAPTVIITGQGLLAPGATVTFGQQPPVAPAQPSTATSLSVQVPAGLPAGQATVRVTLPAQVGQLSLPAAESNEAVLLIRPAITQQGGAYDITAAGGQITVGVAPAAGRDQQAFLLLIQAPGGGAAASYTLAAQSRLTDPQPATSTLTFPAAAVAAGQYLVVVQVDGVASELVLGADGTPVGPLVTL